MSALSDLHTLTADPEALVMALADVAEVLREARGAGVAAPLACPGAHPSGAWFYWGPQRWCAACGFKVLAAEHWHALLASSLRYAVAVQPWPVGKAVAA